MRTKVFLLFGALSLVQGFAEAQGDWELDLDEGGVKVFIRAEDNDDMSVRVETIARTTVAEVKAVLDDPPSYAEWVHRCEEAYRVPGGKDDKYVYYSHIQLPFPFSDKEVVARIDQTFNATTQVLVRKILSEPDALPANKSRDRLTTYTAEWKVNLMADGRVSIICTCRTAAGSGLPNWVRKEIMTGGPAKTMRNLVDRLENVRG